MNGLLLTIYILLIILICVGIVLGIKLIIFTHKATKTLDNLEEKLNTFNGVVNMINKVENIKDSLAHFVIGKLRKGKG